jgi:hypothetical protein
VVLSYICGSFGRRFGPAQASILFPSPLSASAGRMYVSEMTWLEIMWFANLRLLSRGTQIN